jgi:hypothetical protein
MNLRKAQSVVVAAVILGVAVVAAIALLSDPATPPRQGADVTDGMVVELHDGMLFFLWDGGVQRIQQPSAFSDADLTDLGITIGDPAPDVLTVGEAGARFALYPFDGPDSTLYLVDGQTMHEVQVVSVSADDIADRPVLDDLVVNRVRIP